MMTIGQLANAVSVNVQTIRYYERRGLLFAQMRSDAGYRYYSVEAVQQIRFIKRAQQLGFSLEEIRDLLTLQVDHPDSCQQVRQRAQSKLGNIEEKLRLLQGIQQALIDLIDACDQKQITDPCPILDVLIAKGNTNEHS